MWRAARSASWPPSKASGIEAVNLKLDAKVESMKEPGKEDADTVAQLMAGAGLCISKHE